MRISVVIPVYNEAATVAKLYASVLATGLADEIILVNDGSTDGTTEILDGLATAAQRHPRHPPAQERRQGRGPAHRHRFRHRGHRSSSRTRIWNTIPSNYGTLLKPILDGRADVVFGSRFLGDTRRVLFFWHSVGNSVLTLLSNIFTNLNLSDMETCYKVFTRNAPWKAS